MSIAAIVTRGYGSFGSIEDVVRAGYGAEAGEGEVVTPPATAQVVVGDGELTWTDHVKAVHEMRMLENQVRTQKKALKKVIQQIKVAEKKVKEKRTEGILVNLQRLEFKRDEIELKLEKLEIQMIPLEMFLQAEIDEDDEEVLHLFQ